MFDLFFAAVFNFIKKNKSLLTAVITAAILICTVRICCVHFNNDISFMLPDHSSVKKSLNVFRDTAIGGKVVISFSLKTDKYSTDELLSGVDKFTSTIKTPLITKVEGTLPSVSPLKSIKRFLEYAPQLITEKKLKKIKRKIKPDGIRKALKKGYIRLAKPGGSFNLALFRLDPLNIYSDIFGSLNRLAGSIDYNILVKKNHLFSYDMKHVLVILETPVSITDTKGSKKLLNYIDEHLDKLPNYINANVICGHLHSVSNEKIIKQDIKFTLFISALGFILLFVLIFQKDFRCFLILLIPVTAGILSIALISVFMKQISYFIVGMGGVITGIAVDYGIHVYGAVMHSSLVKENENNFLNAVKNVAKPTITGCFTTVGIFLAFFFSDVQGYHQLSLFAIFSIIVSLFFALFILPQFLNRNKNVNISLLDRVDPEKMISKPLIGGMLVTVWTICMVLFLFMASNQSLNTDISQLDGTPEKIINNEKKFQKIWGGADKPAVLVTTGSSLNSLFKKNEKINKKLSDIIGSKNYFNLTAIWPSVSTRKKNLENWRKFWHRNGKKLKRLFAEYSSVYGFRKNAFKPFFKSLKSDRKVTAFPADNLMFEKLSSEFLYKKGNLYYMLSFFPDKKSLIKKAEEFCSNYPDMFIVSRKAFSNIISRSVSREINNIALIAAILIPILAFIFLRSVLKTALALIPVMSGLISTGAILYLLNMQLNGPVIIALLITVGLSIDYGIFMVYHNTVKKREGTFSAVTLSAFTTMIGAGAVVFARHPLLNSIGTTLIIGVTAGYLAAVIIIPSLINLCRKRDTK